MQPRDRYLAVLLHGQTDRVPLMPGGPRESTLRAWRHHGLADGANYVNALEAALGFPLEHPRLAALPVHLTMIPEYEERVLERRSGHLVVQDWKGNVVEIADCYDASYLRHARDFVTRRWIRCPVMERADWPAVRDRYRADDPRRWPADWMVRAAAHSHDTSVVTTIQVNGPFWQLREWCGFERLCELFVDDPAFVEQMIEFWADFVSGILTRVLKHARLDRLGISEDMAFKAHSMVSPHMTRRFLLPAWKRWVDQVRSAGCPLVDMDSDGYIGELIPIWLDAGINVCDPLEVAAGNDLPAYAGVCGRRMAWFGGVDKRAIAQGGVTMRRELERLAPVIEAGGYIPSCDHAIPPDISWPDFVAYAQTLAHYCGYASAGAGLG